MPASLNGTSGLTYPDGTVQNTVGYSPWRNRLLNGDFRLDQRNAGASVTLAGAAYTLDRWYAEISQSSKLTFQQVVDAPTGFKNSIKIAVASQYAPAAGDFFSLQQKIEGVNVVDFAFGSSGATSITLSNYIKSSVAGTYAVSISNSAGNRSYVGTVAVTSSWTQVVVTIPGDVTGTWVTDTGVGLNLRFDLGCGTNYNTTANAWQAANVFRTAGCVTFVNQPVGSTLNITGVQLEAGSTATPFERVDYSEMLRRCMRYYETASFVGFNYFGGAGAGWNVLTYPFKAEKRAAPTVAFSGMSYATCNTIATGVVTTSVLNMTVSATGAGGGSCNGTFTASAEL